MIELGFLGAGILIGAVVMFFVYRNNVKTANKLASDAQSVVAKAQAAAKAAGVKL
jgi:hypothetical protein